MSDFREPAEKSSPSPAVSADEAALRALHGPLVRMCRTAARAILAIYNSTYEIETKVDLSPVTAADRAAHDVLVAQLRTLTPGIPIVSEEGAIPPWRVRRTWRRFWLVDPLDGTKEFIKHNGEFSVNVALIDHGAPLLGVVYEPVAAVWHLGHVGVGVWRGTDMGAPTSRELTTLPYPRPAGRLRAAVSRSHHTERLAPLLDAWPITERVRLGSSLKYCRMVDGELDVYPRLGPTSGWDTAAAHAVLAAGGGDIVDETGAALRYNAHASLLNPCFLAVADRAILGALLPAFTTAAHTDWR